MRSPSRPPPLQIYDHPAAHLVSPSSSIFVTPPTAEKTARTPTHRLTPRKGRLLSRGLPPLSPVSEIDESCRPSIFNTDDVQSDGLLDTQLCSLLAKIDTFKSGWYEEDDNHDGEGDEEESSTDLHHELSNVQIIRYSRAEVKPPIKSPHGVTHLFQYTRFESNHSSPPSSMMIALKNHHTSHSKEGQEPGPPPRSESARSSSSSLGGILSDFPMPPSALPPPQPAVLVSSPVEPIEKPLPSPVSPAKETKPRLTARLSPRASASPDDAFLHPRPAPRPPPRSASTPNLKVVSSMLSSLDASTTNTLASRRVKRPAKLEPVPSTSAWRVIHVANSSSSSIEEETLRQTQPEASKASSLHSVSPRRARITPGETSVNSSWRETIDAMYSKPPIPPKPTHFLSPPSPPSPPSPSASPSGSNSLPVTSSSSSSSTCPSTPVAPMSPNATVPRGILKKRHPPPPTCPPPPPPPLPLSPLRSGVPPTPSTGPLPRSPSRSNTSLDSKTPPLNPSLTPPTTPFPPHDKRNLPVKPPTPPKSYVISSLPGPGSPEPGSGSESSGSGKTVRSHSSSSSSSFGSVHENVRERYLRRGVSQSSSSSSSHYSRSSEEGRRSRSRAGSTMSSSSSSGSSVNSRSGNTLPTRASIPLALLIR